MRRIAADRAERPHEVRPAAHAQVRNASELSRAFAVADTTVRGYLDLLASASMVRLLMPWSENLAKQQVKAPNVYLRDTGLPRALLRSWGRRCRRRSRGVSFRSGGGS